MNAPNQPTEISNSLPTAENPKVEYQIGDIQFGWSILEPLIEEKNVKAIIYKVTLSLNKSGIKPASHDYYVARYVYPKGRYLTPVQINAMTQNIDKIVPKDLVIWSDLRNANFDLRVVWDAFKLLTIYTKNYRTGKWLGTTQVLVGRDESLKHDAINLIKRLDGLATAVYSEEESLNNTNQILTKVFLKRL